MDEVIIGIDLGTTNSAVGVVDSGFPILLANEEGKRVMASAVAYEEGEVVAVGSAALRRRAGGGERGAAGAARSGGVVTSVKRLMGRRFGEETGFSQEVTSGEDGGVEVLGKAPEVVSAAILAELKRVAEWRLEREVRKAVITVPAYFNEGQRSATKRAGELAGLEVVRILNEPTAAALAYGLDRMDERARVAVYDFGGGTFDLSVLEMQDGVFQVLSTRGDTMLGGDDLDRALAGWCAEKLGVGGAAGGTRSGVDARFLEEAERVKRVLSEKESETFRLPFYEGSRSLEMEVTRGDFERLAAGIVERTIGCCRQAMHDAGMEVSALDAVVLVGGSTRVPSVREAVKGFFGREPDLSQHPDEAIALGATIQAGVMSGALRKMVLLDVTPLSLGVETFGGLMNVLIPRNTTIPCKAGEMFTNAAAGQRAMKIRVLQGEREMARDNWELGEFEVGFEGGAKGSARVGVQFRIDEDGLLEVLVRDTETGKDTVLEIRMAAVAVDDARVEAMVSESVEHAFEDMAERVHTEARLKAEELLPAVAAVLGQGGDLVSAEERGEIESAVAEVEGCLERGAAQPLKAAVQRLDVATEAVAAKLVERAMEEAMARRLEG